MSVIGARARPRVGLMGIGLAAYWPQFEGLHERLLGYQRDVEEQLAALGADVVSAGLVGYSAGWNLPVLLLTLCLAAITARRRVRGEAGGRRKNRFV